MIKLVSAEEFAAAKDARLADMSQSSTTAAETVQNLTNLTESMRHSTREHISSLVAHAASNMDEIRQAWLQREKYRAYADAKNAALKYLQERCLQAIESLANEETGDGKDKKGKSKHKDAKKKK